MSFRARIVGLGVVGLIVAAIVVGVVTRAPSVPALKPAPVVNHPAPSFTLRDLRNHTVRLENERGRVALVNFWATWCVPCLQEMPLIDRLALKNPGSLTALAIDERESPSAARSFISAHRLKLTPLLDSTGQVGYAYHVVAQPVTFWIDRKGVIRAIHYGAMSESYARSELQKLKRGSR